MQDSSFPPHVILLLPLRAISILHCIRASMISAPGPSSVTMRPSAGEDRFQNLLEAY